MLVFAPCTSTTMVTASCRVHDSWGVHVHVYSQNRNVTSRVSMVFCGGRETEVSLCAQLVGTN